MRFSHRPSLPVRGALLAVVLGAGLVAPPAAATTVVRQTLASLTASADLVVRGRVEQLAGHVPTERGHAFRLARVRVLESLRGDAPSVLAVRLPGGVSARGRVVVIPGVPELARGDEVVLFLEELPAAVTRQPAEPAPFAREGTRGPASHAEPAIGPPAARQWVPVSLGVGAYRVLREGAEAVAVQYEAAATLRQVGPVSAAAAAPARAPLDELSAAVRGSSPPRGDR